MRTPVLNLFQEGKRRHVLFFINGETQALPVADNDTLDTLIKTIRTTLSGEASLISSILIDGVELNEHEEALLGPLPVSEVGSVEVRTAHPREMADETLQTLIPFSLHIEELCAVVAARFRAGESPPEFTRLIDDIQVFSDAYQSVKQVMRLGLITSIQVLEADLVSIMKDALTYSQNGNPGYVAELLETHLPQNLREWREVGIPTILKARQS